MAEEIPPQQQHVHNTTLSELLVYYLSERNKKVGLIPWAIARGADVLLSKGIMDGPCYSEVCSLPRGYCRYIPRRTSSRPLIDIFNDTSSFTQQGANRHGQDNCMGVPRADRGDEHVLGYLGSENCFGSYRCSFS